MKKIRSYIAILAALSVFAAGGIAPAGAPVSENPVFDGKIYGVPSEPVDEGGYIPVEVYAPPVDDDVDFSKARLELSGYESGEEDVDGFDTTADVPAAYPAAYSATDALHAYVNDQLPPLRSQGSDGTCWAHSVMALNEIYMLKKGLQDAKGYTSNRDINYSELHLAHFCFNTITNEIYGDRGESVSLISGNPFSVGGNAMWASELLSARGGVTGEDIFPYSLSGTIKNDTSAFTQDKAFYEDLVHLENCYVIDYENNRKQIKQAVLENGAASLSYRANVSGAFNSTYDSYCCNSSYSANHGVTIVGWDDDFPKECFNNVPDENGAWLIRNSWLDGLNNPGKEPFCKDGYFWLSYFDKSIYQAAYAMDAVNADEDYAHNYRYVNSIFAEAALSEINNYANVFTVPEDAIDQVLKAVRFHSYGADNSYEIEIYKNVTRGGSPSTGKRVSDATTTGKAEFAGIYTVPLKSGVALSPGESFAVVITPSQSISFEASMTSSYSDVLRTDSTMNEGESFYKTKLVWRDFINYNLKRNGVSVPHGNFCIGALTDDATPKPHMGNVETEAVGTGVLINWTDIDGADTYVLKRAQTVTGDSFEEIGTVASGTGSFVDTGLLPKTDYYYRVIPATENGELPGQRSRIFKVTTGEESEMQALSGNGIYKVSHYKMDRNGTDYTLMQTQTLQAPSGMRVSPPTKEYTGFTAPEIQSIIVSENTVEKVDYYYARNIHSVSVNKTPGIESVSGEGEHYYDTPVKLEAVVSEGYSFDGFEGDYSTDEFTMPDKDVMILAKAVKDETDRKDSSSESSASEGSSSGSSSTESSDKESSSTENPYSGSTSSKGSSSSASSSQDPSASDRSSSSESVRSSAKAGGSDSRKDSETGSTSASAKKSSSGSSSSVKDSADTGVSGNMIVDPQDREKNSYTDKAEVRSTVGECFDIALELDYCVYDGMKKTPKVQITDGEGHMLTPGTDYRISFRNNKNANMEYDEETGTFVRRNILKHPTYTVKFKGRHKSAGKLTGTFDIYPYPLSFAYLQPVKDVITVKTGRSFRFLKKGTAYLAGKQKSLNVMRDMDPVRISMECIEGDNAGAVYTMTDNYKAPAGKYVINAFGNGNFYYHKQDGVFTLIRK